MHEGHIEPCPRRVRAEHHGEVVLVSDDAQYLWEHDHYPAWYVPEAHVRLDLIDATALRRDERLPGHVRIAWSALDHWFEEDDEVHQHPRDPYKRVDVRAGSRHVQVSLDGVILADSHRPVLLFETTLPTRYYLPKLDVRFDHLAPTATRSTCPYKGEAEYWAVSVNGTTHPDLAWGYRYPLPEVSKIADHVCFYNERVDIVLDGTAVPRPTTHF
jgi:uncharacterized protein (DUF427 family)